MPHAHKIFAFAHRTHRNRSEEDAKPRGNDDAGVKRGGNVPPSALPDSSIPEAAAAAAATPKKRVWIASLTKIRFLFGKKKKSEDEVAPAVAPPTSSPPPSSFRFPRFPSLKRKHPVIGAHQTIVENVIGDRRSLWLNTTTEETKESIDTRIDGSPDACPALAAAPEESAISSAEKEKGHVEEEEEKKVDVLLEAASVPLPLSTEEETEFFSRQETEGSPAEVLPEREEQAREPNEEGPRSLQETTVEAVSQGIPVPPPDVADASSNPEPSEDVVEAPSLPEHSPSAPEPSEDVADPPSALEPSDDIVDQPSAHELSDDIVDRRSAPDIVVRPSAPEPSDDIVDRPSAPEPSDDIAIAPATDDESTLYSDREEVEVGNERDVASSDVKDEAESPVSEAPSSPSVYDEEDLPLEVAVMTPVPFDDLELTREEGEEEEIATEPVTSPATARAPGEEVDEAAPEELATDKVVEDSSGPAGSNALEVFAEDVSVTSPVDEEHGSETFGDEVAPKEEVAVFVAGEFPEEGIAVPAAPYQEELEAYQEQVDAASPVISYRDQAVISPSEEVAAPTLEVVVSSLDEVVAVTPSTTDVSPLEEGSLATSEEAPISPAEEIVFSPPGDIIFSHSEGTATSSSEVIVSPSAEETVQKQPIVVHTEEVANTPQEEIVFFPPEKEVVSCSDAGEWVLREEMASSVAPDEEGFTHQDQQALVPGFIFEEGKADDKDTFGGSQPDEIIVVPRRPFGSDPFSEALASEREQESIVVLKPRDREVNLPEAAGSSAKSMAMRRGKENSQMDDRGPLRVSKLTDVDALFRGPDTFFGESFNFQAGTRRASDAYERLPPPPSRPSQTVREVYNPSSMFKYGPSVPEHANPPFKQLPPPLDFHHGIPASPPMQSHMPPHPPMQSHIPPPQLTHPHMPPPPPPPMHSPMPPPYMPRPQDMGTWNYGLPAYDTRPSTPSYPTYPFMRPATPSKLNAHAPVFVPRTRQQQLTDSSPTLNPRAPSFVPTRSRQESPMSSAPNSRPVTPGRTNLNPFAAPFVPTYRRSEWQTYYSPSDYI